MASTEQEKRLTLTLEEVCLSCWYFWSAYHRPLMLLIIPKGLCCRKEALLPATYSTNCMLFLKTLVYGFLDLMKQ